MITQKSLDSYRAQYPDDAIFYLVPSAQVVITHGEDDYVQPEEETDAGFMTRLTESKAQGKNLFLTQWDKLKNDGSIIY